MTYPKRLIEVDLPIKRISAHARREKSIRHGHISTLHIWWARRPLAACRAVICASLWPDPADVNCPQAFRETALQQMLAFSKATQSNKDLAAICDAESWKRYKLLGEGKSIDLGKPKDLERLRSYLLDFIADAASWEASTHRVFLDTARFLTQSAHEALGGEKGTRPLVVDPFAGGGAIPLEAIRVGADAYGSDLNPLPVLLNRVVLELIPRFGSRLVEAVRKHGDELIRIAEHQLGGHYPSEPNGATQIAYVWARTVLCEGPSCGTTVPLLSSLWLAKRGRNSVALGIGADEHRKAVTLTIIQNAKASEVSGGTVKRGSVTCPCCGYTTPVASVRSQLKRRAGGAADSMLVAVVTAKQGQQGRSYRLPTTEDLAVVNVAAEASRVLGTRKSGLSSVPNEPLPEMSGVFNAPLYGHNTWGTLFTPRQALALSVLVDAIDQLVEDTDIEFARAVRTCLALAVSRVAAQSTSLCRWQSKGEFCVGIFGRQAIPMLWDYCEVRPVNGASGDLNGSLDWVIRVLERETLANLPLGTIGHHSATAHALPDDSAAALVTDPPYYNAVPYADLSDFFYVWLRRMLSLTHPSLFKDALAPKADEICEMSGWDPVRYANKDKAFFEHAMTLALAEARRVVAPTGIGVIVFAHTTTHGWEAMLQSVISSGWIITASWPIDTERSVRPRAQDSAALSSSIHLVCRPREDADGTVRQNEIGDWRDVLAELPKRTREWMKRLAEEGVVGADAIFACLGPALEIFSRYSRVEKASGEPVLLKEYLTYVWGAVAQEALTQIFQGADATGFEEDARLTAMWLWTLNAGGAVQTATTETSPDAEDAESANEAEDDDEDGGGKPKGGGYVLDFDAARKIAQGLGAHLDQMSGVIEVKGDKARLLGVGERTRKLFGRDEAETPQAKGKKKPKQMSLGFMQEIEAAEAEGGWGDKSVPKLGDTVLDRIHQSMILFAAGRGEALRRFLVEDGAGRDQRFWKLANALSALYPQGTDEKRWVDGVLARKKGLGL